MASPAQVKINPIRLHISASSCRTQYFLATFKSFSKPHTFAKILLKLRTDSSALTHATDEKIVCTCIRRCVQAQRGFGFGSFSMTAAQEIAFCNTVQKKASSSRFSCPSICPIQKEKLGDSHSGKGYEVPGDLDIHGTACSYSGSPEASSSVVNRGLFYERARLKVAKVAVRSVILCRDGPQAKRIQRMGAPS